MGAALAQYMYDVVVKKFTLAISSPDEILSVFISFSFQFEFQFLQRAAMLALQALY